jgi:uncharacterized protein (TIGR02611 family)
MARHPIVKLGIVLGGSLLLVGGVIMLVTPGPGLVGIAAGLAVLGQEYHWARRLLERVRERIQREKDKRAAKQKPPQAPPPAAK